MVTTAVMLISLLASIAYPIVYDLAVTRPYQQQQQAEAEARSAALADKQYQKSLEDSERLAAQQKADSEAYTAEYERRERSRRRAQAFGSSRYRGRTTIK